MIIQRRHGIAIACVGFAMLVTECVLAVITNNIKDLQKQVSSLQAENKALKDISDGQDIHQRFIDSDHQRLTESVVRLRDDLDELRYKQDGWEQLSRPIHR